MRVTSAVESSAFAPERGFALRKSWSMEYAIGPPSDLAPSAAAPLAAALAAVLAAPLATEAPAWAPVPHTGPQVEPHEPRREERGHGPGEEAVGGVAEG